MNSHSFDLATLQSWMQSVMLDSESRRLDGGVANVDEVITASRQQTSRERLDVYRNAYQARLMECLREEFATLNQFLGEEAFIGLAVAYLQACPSRSYTLADLGARFPQFLRDSAPTAEDDIATEADGAQMVQFLVDLATLERVYAEVFDGPGIEGLPLISTEFLRTLDPANWAEVRFEPAPCLRLVELAFPVHEFVTSCRQGTEPPPPEHQETWLAVTRRQYIVRRAALTRQQFQLLRLLSQGVPLGAALDDVADACTDVDAFSKDLERWFQEWTGAGYFQAITAPVPKK